MADDDKILTLGQLREFLNNSGLPDDAMLMILESDIDDPREVTEVPLARVTASIGIGQSSTVTFHSF